MQPPHIKLAERMERVSDANMSLTALFKGYNAACAQSDWKKADEIRVTLIETVESLLDCMAAVFKVNDQGKDHGKA